MPPRIVVLLIVIFWLGSTGWLARQEWWPWLQADTPPPFTVELADEAAPLYAQWTIWRGNRQIGMASTSMMFRKDNTFELHSTVDKLELFAGDGTLTRPRITVPRMSTIQRVTRDGKLLSISSDLQLVVIARELNLEASAGLDGIVADGKLMARGWLQSQFTGKIERQLDPLPLDSGNIINPLQPVAKLAVHPGQRWKITHVDPLEQAVAAALKQNSLPQLVDASPKVILAQVLPDARGLDHHGTVFPCHVVEYRSKGIEGTTWVRISDNKVLQQEVSGVGEKLTLIRED